MVAMILISMVTVNSLGSVNSLCYESGPWFKKKLAITCSRYSKNKENSLIIIGAHRVRCTPNSTINYS